MQERKWLQPAAQRGAAAAEILVDSNLAQFLVDWVLVAGEAVKMSACGFCLLIHKVGE